MENDRSKARMAEAPVLDKEKAVELAVKYLDYGYRTEKQMSDYLKKKGAGPEAAEYAVAKLKEYNYINDFTYCREYAEKYAAVSGIYKVKADLLRKGADKQAVEQALAAIDENSQDNAALALAEKKMRETKEAGMTPKLYQKISRYLYGRGFSWDAIEKALSEISGKAQNDD